MVKEQLVDTDIKAGAELIRNLLCSDFRLEAAYWEDQSDASDWRPSSAWKLVLATPLIQEKGPLYAIRYLRELTSAARVSHAAREIVEYVTIVSPNHANLMPVPTDSRNAGQREGWFSGLYVYLFAPQTFFSIDDQLDDSVLTR